MKYTLFLRNAGSEALQDGIPVEDTMLPRVGDSYWLSSFPPELSREAREEFPQGEWYRVLEVRRDLVLITRLEVRRDLVLITRDQGLEGLADTDSNTYVVIERV